MIDGIQLVVGENGEAKIYDDTYDIVIHCESQEEQDKAIKKLNSMNWIPCSERLPSKNQWNDAFLVTVQCEHVDEWDDYVVCGAEYSEYGWDYMPCPLGAIKVVAWMPITAEPYKPKETE